MKKRGSYHPNLNAYKNPLNQGSKIEYSQEMLPQTLQILKTTVLIGLHPDWNHEQSNRVAKAICQAHH